MIDEYRFLYEINRQYRCDMRGSVIYQVTTCLDSLNKFGSSKYEAKQNLMKAGITKSSDIARNTGIYSENTMKNYINAGVQAFQYIREEFGIKDITKITGEHIKSYLEQRASEVEYKTLKIDMAGINKLEQAINNYNNTDVNFRSTVEDFRQEIKLDKEYIANNDESRALLNPTGVVNSLSDESHKLVAGMQLEYGFRLNEVAKIDLNKQLDNNTLSVQAKGGQIISKELSQEHITKLQELSSNGIFNINKLEYGNDLKNACEANSETYTGSHALRHNYAQNQFESYAKAGMNYNKCLHSTAEDLGHHREDITHRYF